MTAGNTAVGARLPAVDAVDKVSGRAHYGADIRLPGMLAGKVLRSPHAHARLLHVDTGPARRLPGVRAVITYEDTPRIAYGPMGVDRYILAHEKVHFIGEEVAAVAAVDAETAEEALALIRVEYEPLAAVFDPLRALEPGAPLIHDDRPGNLALRIAFERGDVEGARARADAVVTRRFRTSLVHPGYLEPNACLAAFEGDHLRLWLPCQAPFEARPIFADALGIPVENISIVQTYVGGAFGGKTWVPVWPVCACLARAAGAPVQIVLTREEEFDTNLPRVPMIIDLTMGAARDGHLLFKDSHVVADNGAYTYSAGAVLSVAATRHDSLYRVPNLRMQAELVYTNTLPTGNMRGYGNPQAHFAAESMIDMLAAELGTDPVDLRLRNATRPGDVSAHGWRITSCALSETIEQAAKAIGWHDRVHVPGTYQGVGVASGIHVSSNRSSYGPYDGSSARVRLHSDGTVEVFSGECDIGQGSRTTFAQIAAEALGAPVESVSVAPVATDTSPFAIGTFGSRVTTIGGEAVRLAAVDACEKVLAAVAAEWRMPTDELEIVNGMVQSRHDPRRSAALGSAVALAGDASREGEVEGEGEYRVEGVTIPDRIGKYGNISSAYSFATHAARVQIDPGTGRVDVLDYVAVHDLGRAINPMGVEGQIEGGVAQGIGYALLEEIKVRDGRVVNGDFLDYRMPTALDLPPVRSIMVESTNPTGPYGAKSVGELALVPAAAAIANAIADATGLRFTELPITPDKILAAIRGKED